MRPAELARAMGVSRWTEWRTRLDAARAGLVRDWTLPDPEARGYGRGAVRVLDLAFVRTREVTQRVAANREEKASRAERRREARRRAKEASRVGDAGDRSAEPPATPERAGEARGADLARRGAALGDAPPAPARSGAGRPGAPALASPAGVAAARAAVPEVEWTDPPAPRRSIDARSRLSSLAGAADDLHPSDADAAEASCAWITSPVPAPVLQQSQPSCAERVRERAHDRRDRRWDQRSRTRQRLLRSQNRRAPAGLGRWPTGAEDQSR